MRVQIYSWVSDIFIGISGIAIGIFSLTGNDPSLSCGLISLIVGIFFLFFGINEAIKIKESGRKLHIFPFRDDMDSILGIEKRVSHEKQQEELRIRQLLFYRKILEDNERRKILETSDKEKQENE